MRFTNSTGGDSGEGRFLENNWNDWILASTSCRECLIQCYFSEFCLECLLFLLAINNQSYTQIHLFMHTGKVPEKDWLAWCYQPEKHMNKYNIERTTGNIC